MRLFPTLSPNNCKSLFYFLNGNSHVEFARSNTNKVAHSFTGVALLSSSHQDYYDVPTCISELINNEMH